MNNSKEIQNTVEKFEHCLVVLSGGQDSVTCLGLALSEFEKVSAISFVYGQRHSNEINSAAEICSTFGVTHTIVDVSFYGKMVESALTSDGDVNDKSTVNPDLPASFVPNRNALFLTLAHAHAQTIGAGVLMTGVCQTDYSGYPDCRDVFIHKMQNTLNCGSETSIIICAPLMHINKAQTFALAEHVGFLDIVLKKSHTCYNGDHDTRHDWGYGCGECPACHLRAKGWEEYISTDWRSADLLP